MYALCQDANGKAFEPCKSAEAKQLEEEIHTAWKTHWEQHRDMWEALKKAQEAQKLVKEGITNVNAMKTWISGNITKAIGFIGQIVTHTKQMHEKTDIPSGTTSTVATVAAPDCGGTKRACNDCTAPSGIANMASAPCNTHVAGAKILHDESCHTQCAQGNPSVAMLKCSDGTLTPSTFTCVVSR